MSEQETLKLVAEVVDKYSGPLKQMMDSLKKLGDGTKDLHEKGRKHTDEHTKAYQKLRDQIVSLKTKGLDIATPALEEMGVSLMGVSAAAAAMGVTIVKASKDWAEYGQKLTFAHRASGLTMDTMRGLAEANQKFGASAEDTLGSLEKFGAHMDQFHRKSWDYINQWKALGGDAFVNIGSKLMALDGDREAQLKKAMEIVPQIRDVDQRKRVLALLGLPENWASLTDKEMQELRRKGEEFTKEHPFNVEGARKLKEAWEGVSSSVRGLETDLGNTFGPAGVAMLNGFAASLETVDGWFKTIRDHVKQGQGGKHDAMTPPLIARMLGAKAHHGATGNFGPGGATGSFDNMSKKDTEDSIAKGTRQGMLDAMRDYKAQSQSQQFAPGLVPQAFHPSGGEGITGLHGGGGYSVLDQSLGATPKSMGRSPDGANNPDYSSGGSSDNSSSIAAMRKPFMDELRDPATRRLAMQMMATEGGAGHGQAALEALMNRTAMIRQKVPGYSIWNELHSGFYGPLNRGARPSISPRAAEMYDRIMGRVGAGSDMISGRTDQGMLTDPNGRGPGRVHVGGSNEVYNFWKGQRGRAQFSWADSAHFAEHMEAIKTAGNGHGAALADMVRRGRPSPRAALEHRSDASGSMSGNAHLKIDLNGFPRGTRTAHAADGIFKQVTLNRGRPMTLGSETS